MKAEVSPVERLLVTVSVRHGLSPAEVRGRCRKSRVVAARHEWWRLVVDSWGLSWAEAARLFGVDHTTVMCALNDDMRARKKLWMARREP